MLIVGSSALKSFGNKYLPNRDPRDIDIICNYDNFLKIKKDLSKNHKLKYSLPSNKGKNISLVYDKFIYDFEIAWDGSTAQELLEILSRSKNLVIYNSNNWMIASPNVIFTLKKSHKYLRNSPHFLKTMNDLKHLKSIGCEVPKELKEWYKKREKETYWYVHPKLNMTKDEFFKDDNVPYKYDHDSIHVCMAHLDKPAYEYFKSPNAEVNCSKRLFFECSEQVRLYAVLEEAYVLALERSQIPLKGKVEPKKSFEIALQKVASSITSGWFRAYAYNHYYDVINLYSPKYVEKFWNGVKSGIVKEMCRNANG